MVKIEPDKMSVTEVESEHSPVEEKSMPFELFPKKSITVQPAAPTKIPAFSIFADLGDIFESHPSVTAVGVSLEKDEITTLPKDSRSKSPGFIGMPPPPPKSVLGGFDTETFDMANIKFDNEIHRILHQYVESRTFNSFILFIIILNTGLLIEGTFYQVDVRGGHVKYWLDLSS